MATINTKFSIGDVVFFATTTVATKSHPCPDCLGKREWETTSPAGHKYTFACPRCSAPFLSNSDLSLQYNARVANVAKLTIGQVRIVTPQVSEYDKTQYMANETGIGSGTLYDEDKLFASETDAWLMAEYQAALANKEVPFIKDRYDKALDIANYQLHDGVEHVAENKLNAFQWRVRDFLDNLHACEDMDHVKKELEAWEKD